MKITTRPLQETVLMQTARNFKRARVSKKSGGIASACGASLYHSMEHMF